MARVFGAYWGIRQGLEGQRKAQNPWMYGQPPSWKVSLGRYRDRKKAKGKKLILENQTHEFM